jgi:hypothetical protein
MLQHQEHVGWHTSTVSSPDIGPGHLDRHLLFEQKLNNVEVGVTLPAKLARLVQKSVSPLCGLDLLLTLAPRGQ